MASIVEAQDSDGDGRADHVHFALPTYKANATIHRSVRNVKKEREQNRLFRVKSIYHDYLYLKTILHDLQIENSVSNNTTSETSCSDDVGNCNIKVYANLRNGLWYYPCFDGTSYFKSTDGHSYKWDFSYKRLNLNVANTAIKDHGIVLIDSTRRGKAFPDSFSMTVPIWCCVLNRAKVLLAKLNKVSCGTDNFDTQLHTPPWILAEEKAAVERLVDKWAQDLISDFNAAAFPILEKLCKPLRAIWVSPQSGLNSFVFDFSSLPFVPIICISVSSMIDDEKFRVKHSFPYIQGAGDDEENWARGLNAKLFWDNYRLLIECKHADEFDETLASLMKDKDSKKQVADLNGSLDGKSSIISMKPLHFYAINWLRRTNIGILCMHTIDKNVDGCKIRVELNLEKFPNVHAQDHRPNDVYVFSSSIDEYEIVLPTPGRKGINVKKLFMPISSSKKGPREKALYMENGFSQFLDFFLLFYHSMKSNRAHEASEQNFFIFLPGHDVSTITLAVAALTVFYDENFGFIDKHKSVEADGRMNKKSFQKTYAVLQMSGDESSARVGSFVSKLPRRHMKYLNEFFTSKYNGRRWYHGLQHWPVVNGE